MISVKIDIGPTIKALQSILDRLRDQRPAWRAVAVYLRTATEKNFASRGARIGEVWQALSDAYARRKAIVFPGQPILRATNGLFRSVTVKGAPGSIADARRAGLTFGTSNPKGAYHQKSRRRPPRRFLGINAEDKRQIRQIVRLHLSNQLRRAE